MSESWLVTSENEDLKKLEEDSNSLVALTVLMSKDCLDYISKQSELSDLTSMTLTLKPSGTQAKEKSQQLCKEGIAGNGWRTYPSTISLNCTKLGGK